MPINPKLDPPGTYEEATEENPHRFGVNAYRHDRMWETNCDGMPTLAGCSGQITHSRPYTRFNMQRKPSGWLLCYGRDENGKPDRKLVLAFCPSCADVVEAQEHSMTVCYPRKGEQCPTLEM